MRLSRFASVAALALVAGAASADDTVPNPEFTSWAKFKKGTSITVAVKHYTGADKVELAMAMTTTLVEVGADKIVVEVTSVGNFNGIEYKTPAEKRDLMKTIKLPDGAKKEDVRERRPGGTTKEGAETIKIGGVEVKTKWFEYTTEADGKKSAGKMWISEEVPGGFVKIESKNTGTETSSLKMELVEIKKP